MKYEFKIDILSGVRSLLGISYLAGQQNQYVFKEIGIGFLFFGIFFTMYKEGEF